MRLITDIPALAAMLFGFFTMFALNGAGDKPKGYESGRGCFFPDHPVRVDGSR